MNTPKVMIFDLDGALTDTSDYRYHAWKHLADDEGIPFTQEENDEHLRGVGRRESLLYLLTGRKVSEAEMQEMMDRKKSLLRRAEVDCYQPGAGQHGPQGDRRTYWKQPQFGAGTSGGGDSQWEVSNYGEADRGEADRRLAERARRECSARSAPRWQTSGGVPRL